MICFPVIKSRSKIFSKIENLRQQIMSENNLFRMFFNEKKNLKMLLNNNELKQLNQLQIFDFEIDELK